MRLLLWKQKSQFNASRRREVGADALDDEKNNNNLIKKNEINPPNVKRDRLKYRPKNKRDNLIMDAQR